MIGAETFSGSLCLSASCAGLAFCTLGFAKPLGETCLAHPGRFQVGARQGDRIAFGCCLPCGLLSVEGVRAASRLRRRGLVGLVIEHSTGRSWRQEVTDRVIRPLGLAATVLPAPGNRSAMGPYAHGYVELNGRVLDVSSVDPSMAGAAGGHALVTTAGDLVRFLDALLAGRLFRRPETLQQMLTFAPAPDVGGQVGYGLGIERRVAPGGVELIGHLGGAGGYYAYVGRLPHQQVTFAAAMNSSADPSLLLLPVFQALANAR